MCSISTILFPQIKSDYAVFTTLGYGWLNGKIPYLELFDHKGPIVFLIQLIALSLNIGKWGIWLFEIIAAVISFELMYRIGILLKLGWKYNIASVFVAMISYFCYVDGGNSVEEWSLPFELWALYLGIKFLLFNKNKVNKVKKYSLYVGICFGLVSLIRINNNCIICGVILALIIHFIKNKEYNYIWDSTLYFILGLIISIIPFIIYFSYFGALKDMFYATFTFNWYYKQAWPTSPFKAVFVMLTPCLILPITSYFYDQKYRTNLFLTSSFIAIITFLTFCNGRDYGHYFLMVVPLTALAMQQSISMPFWLKFFTIIYLLFPAYLFRNRPYEYFKNIHQNQIEASQSFYSRPVVDAIAEIIPAKDLWSVYTYGDLELGAYLYELGESPIGKFSFFQNKFLNVDKGIKQQIQCSFKESSPKWILSSIDIKNEDVFNDFIDNYSEFPKDRLPEAIQSEGLFIYYKK